MGSDFDPEIPRLASEIAAEVERRRRSKLRRIDAALARLEAGEYGYCLICGEQIAASRLDREPTTDCCTACARPVNGNS